MGHSAKAAFLFFLCFGLRSSLADELSPEETVRRYLTAMQEHKFSEAYNYVSKEMVHDADRETWAKEQQYIFDFGEVKIFGFQVFPGKMEGEVAKVPNLLRSQDKFLNQLGADEHEVYTLVKEDGKWKVDQQIIVTGSDIPRWFPPPKTE